jgi:hypothetical protein
MAQQVDYQTVVDNFWQLAQLVDADSKVILTSRTEFFRELDESERVLGGRELGRRSQELRPPRFEIVYLAPLTAPQIETVIASRLPGASGAELAARILGTPNLAGMAQKPVLIDLLIAALQQVGEAALESTAHVYLYATNRLLLRNIDTHRTFTTTRDKLVFLCELAWHMMVVENLRIHYTEIPGQIKSFFGDRIKDQHSLDMWDFDLRNQTLLHRDAAGYYEFAHKSLVEYFSAFKIAAELGALRSAFRKTYLEANGSPCTLDSLASASMAESNSLGQLRLSASRVRTMRQMLAEMMDPASAFQALTVLAEGSVLSEGSESRYVGGNAITLLVDLGHSLRGLDLRGAHIEGADLSVLDLRGLNLNGAHIDGADLRGAFFDASTLRGCEFEEVRLRVHFALPVRTPNDHDAIRLLGTSTHSRQSRISWQTKVTGRGVRAKGFLDLWVREDISSWREAWKRDLDRVADLAGLKLALTAAEILRLGIKPPSFHFTGFFPESPVAARLARLAQDMAKTDAQTGQRPR